MLPTAVAREDRDAMRSVLALPAIGEDVSDPIAPAMTGALTPPESDPRHARLSSEKLQLPLL
jgi:hypothetical protein